MPVFYGMQFDFTGTGQSGTATIEVGDYDIYISDINASLRVGTLTNLETFKISAEDNNGNKYTDTPVDVFALSQFFRNHRSMGMYLKAHRRYTFVMTCTAGVAAEHPAAVLLTLSGYKQLTNR